MTLFGCSENWCSEYTDFRNTQERSTQFRSEKSVGFPRRSAGRTLGPTFGRSALPDRDGVIRFPHRRKISSILIRNTVVPIATPTALGSCWRLKRGSRSNDNNPCKAPGAKTAASRTAARRFWSGRTGASRTTVSQNKQGDGLAGWGGRKR
jgi:hypothetical protein